MAHVRSRSAIGHHPQQRCRALALRSVSGKCAPGGAGDGSVVVGVLAATPFVLLAESTVGRGGGRPQVPDVRFQSVGTDIARGDTNSGHGGVGGIGHKHSRVDAGPEVLHYGPVKNFPGKDGGDAGRVRRERFGADPADRL